MVESLAELEVLLAPCAGTDVGIDARYEPLHESIRSRVAILDAPSGGPVDWPAIVQDSKTLLGTSKDLVVASFLAFGWFDARGLSGLIDGLELLSQMAERYWDDVFPTRPKARANAVRWLTERVVPRMVDIPLGPTDHQAVANLESVASGLAKVVAARFGDQAPAMRPLVDAAKRLALSLPPRPAGVEPEPEESASTEATARKDVPPGPATDVARAPDVLPPESQTSSRPSEEPAEPEDPLAAARDRVASLLEPIAGEHPAGEDARYDPLHEHVRAQTASLDTPTGGEVDWDEVLANCEALLRDKSKDILIASFWAYGRYLRDGLDGVIDGLTLLTGVLDTYWEGAQPAKKREKARVNAVSWLVDRLGDISAAPVTATDAPRVAALAAAVKELGRVTGERFVDRLPPIRPLTTEVERLRLSLPKPEPELAKAPATTVAKAPQAVVARPAPAKASVANVPDVDAPKGADDLQPFLQKSGTALHQAGRLLFRVDPSDADGYRLSRLGLFIHLSNPPSSSDGVKTSIPAPPPKFVTQLETLFAHANWSALLEEAESATATHRFWIDLQRYVALALTNLGHEAARNAVMCEVRSLLVRMPSLVELTFGNGQALCSDATREWIAGEASGSGAGAAPTGSVEDGGIAAARQAAAKGGVDDALPHLEELASTAPSERLRFEARLTMAELLGRGAASMVDGLCTSLIRDVDRFGLDHWDPELSSRLYKTHLDALDALATNAKNNISERRAVVYSRLCRVAPLVAMKRR